MRNWKIAGMRNLKRGLVWLLAAMMLITMLPLAGLAAGHLSGAAAGQNPGNAPAFLSAYTAHAASYPTSGECGESAKWSFNKKTGALTISGSGEMWDWEDPLDEDAEYIAPWVAYYYDSIKTIGINNGITAIGAYSFAECMNASSVSIPGSVRHIQEGAFQECSALGTVSIPNGVETMGEFCFAFCESFKEVTIPASVRELSSTAFFYCNKLERINITSGNRYLKSVDGVVFTSSDDKLVIYPTAKKDHIYSIPGNASRISEFAFAYNKYLRAVLMTDNMIYLEQGAFAYNENLIRFYTPGGLRQIGDDCFIGCNKLTDIYFYGDQYSRNMVAVGKNNPSVWSAEWHYKGTRADCLFALFEDVPKDSWFYEHVIWAAAKNITTGTSDITFSPNDPCVRAQMVTFLWRAAGEPEPTSMEMKFTDVQKDAYYAKAVAWAVENNITQGTSETTFSPNGKLERGQTVTFLYRWANPGWDGAAEDPSGEPEVTNPFDDITGDEYYAKAVFWSVKNNITQGMTPTTFAPKETCNRAQIVTFLHRAVGGEPDKAA